MTRMLSSFRAILGAGVCLLPLTAFAQSDSGFDVDEKSAATAALPASNNWIELGGQYNSARSYYLGRYNGVVDPGFSGLAGLHYSDRDAWDSGGTHYFDFTGENLGRSDRSVAIRLGEQGTWGLAFTYDGIPYYASNSFQSIFNMTKDGVGTARSMVTAAYSPNYIVPSGIPTTATVTPVFHYAPAVGANMLTYKLSTQRDIFTLGGKYQWDDWTITSGWRHEHKEGWQANSLEFVGAPSAVGAGTYRAGVATAPSPSGNGMAYFAQPINYDMERFDIAAAYSTQKLQAQLGYTYSQFQDNVSTLQIQNPFTLSQASSTGAAYSLPPDNAAHQFKLMLGYNFTPTTRLNANFGYGLQMQNASLDYGTGNSVAGAYTATNHGANFDGLIQTTFANIALTAQPLHRLNVRVAYTIDNRENQSPRNLYSNINPNSSIGSSPERPAYNLPFSIHHQVGTIEAGYRLAPQTKLTLTQTLDDMRRNYTATPDVVTERTAIKLRGPILDSLFGSLSAAHEQRWASNYNQEGWWNVSCGGISGCGQTELKSLVMYSEASRTHDEVKSLLDFQPLDSVSVSLMGKVAKDSYPTNSSGMRSNYNASIGPDISWQVSKEMSVHAYYTYQQIYYNQSSIYSTGTTGTGGTGAYVPYNMQTTDSVQSLGVNADWQVIPEKLKLSLDGNLSSGDTAYALGDGMAVYGTAIASGTTMALLNMKPLPDVKSTLITVGIHGEYNFQPNITLLFGYYWEKFNYKDYMVGTSSTQYANILLPGSLAPNDSVHVVSAALRVRF